MTKVYINKNYELNTVGEGKLASINDLQEDLCQGGEPILDKIELAEGYYEWIDLTEVDDLDFCGYVKLKDYIIHKSIA